MTSPGTMRQRLRPSLLRAAGVLPRERVPERLRRLAREGRVAAAERLVGSDPRAALARLELELDADSSADLLRTAADAAWRSDDLVRTVELTHRLWDADGAGFIECVRWSKAARTLGLGDELADAQDALLTLTPRRQNAFDLCARALRGIGLSRRAEVQAWGARVAKHDPSIDQSALDRVLLDIDVRDVLGRSELDGAAVAEMLTREDGPEMIIGGLLRARRYADLAALVPTLSPETSAQVTSSRWRLVSRWALASGWTHLAASALAQLDEVELDIDEETRRRHILMEAADEQEMLRTPWRPPAPAAAPYSDDLDPRSVISVLGQSLPLRSGGYATRSHGLLTGLARRGWRMTAVTRLGFPFDLWWSPDDARTPAAVDVVDGIPYHRLLVEGVRHYPRIPLREYVDGTAQGVVDLTRQQRASVIHASSLYDVGMAGLSAARRLGVPFVYEMRGLKQLLEDARQPNFSTSPRHDYLDLLEGTVARDADALLVITEALGREMVRLGVDPARITVVPNGVDSSRFTPRARDEELAAELGVSGKTVIGYVGGLVHYEGLELLFTAAEELRARRSDFHVLVVGDGAHQRALHRMVDERELGDLVTFTGRVLHEEVERYLSIVDIAPFPRKPLPVCELISPIKPFEAMAMHKAVVASDVAALAEIVQDGVTGRLFAKGDAADLARVLEELLDDPAARERLGEDARRWVLAERDWQTITTIVDGVYDALLRESTEA